jgi:hypothetical protein
MCCPDKAAVVNSIAHLPFRCISSSTRRQLLTKLLALGRLLHLLLFTILITALRLLPWLTSCCCCCLPFSSASASA